MRSSLSKSSMRIFRIEKQDDVLLVYEIDYRGDVYK